MSVTTWKCRACKKQNSVRDNDPGRYRAACKCGEPLFVNPAMAFKRENEKQTKGIAPAQFVEIEPEPVFKFSCNGCGEHFERPAPPFVYEEGDEAKIVEYCSLACRQDKLDRCKKEFLSRNETVS